MIIKKYVVGIEDEVLQGKKNPQHKNHQKDNTEAFLSKRWDDEGQGMNTRLDQRWNSI